MAVLMAIGSEVSDDAGQLEHCLRGVLESQHHLKKRVARQRAHRIKKLNQPLEGQLLMGVGRQIHCPHPGQQLTETGVSRGVAP